MPNAYVNVKDQIGGEEKEVERERQEKAGHKACMEAGVGEGRQKPASAGAQAARGGREGRKGRQADPPPDPVSTPSFGVGAKGVKWKAAKEA